MDDRELLDLAAKAVGGKFSPGTTQHRTGPTWEDWEWVGPAGIVIEGLVIYPMTDNGDALWVAANLKLSIDMKTIVVSVEQIGGNAIGFGESCNNNEYSRLKAVRRAIVRAAAEIGSAMP